MSLVEMGVCMEDRCGICGPSDFPCQRKMDGIHGNGRMKRNSIPGVQCAPKDDFQNAHAQDAPVAAVFFFFPS